MENFSWIKILWVLPHKIHKKITVGCMVLCYALVLFCKRFKLAIDCFIRVYHENLM